MTQAIESTVTEAIHSPSALTVDREKGVIRGVRVLNMKSRNGYDYTPEAVKSAVQAYEGRVVNIDHTPKPGMDRSSRDRFGRLVNVQHVQDGLTADLEYLKAHPMAGIVTEAAERMPEVFGLSHEAKVRWRTPTKTVAESILSVRSVDVVANPATTSSLQESNRSQTVAITFGQVREKLGAKTSARKFYDLVHEADTGAGAMAMDAGASPPADAAAVAASPDDALKQGFITAMNSALESYSKGELDIKGMLAKIEELATMMEQATGTPEAPEPKVKESQKPAKTSTDPLVSDLQEQLKTMQRKDLARSLCDAEGVKPSNALLKALVALGTESDMKELIQESKQPETETPAPAGAKPAKPAVKSGHQTTTVQEAKKTDAKVPDSFEDFSRLVFDRKPAA